MHVQLASTTVQLNEALADSNKGVSNHVAVGQLHRALLVFCFQSG